MKDSMKTLTALTDEELAVRYMDGDNEAFDLLLKHNQSKLFTYIFFMVHDEEKANDFSGHIHQDNHEIAGWYVFSIR